MNKTPLRGVSSVEGETIETKVTRLLNNKEPIKDGAPEIYTERKQGVLQGYNIRTDRWEVAAEAMDKVNASREAKRDNKPGTKTEEEGKEKVQEKNIGEPEPTHGEADK